MKLETERLVLRPFKEADGEALFDYLSDAEVLKFEPYKPFSREKAEQEAIRRAVNKDFIAVCLKDTDCLIGNLYLAKGDFDTWTIGYVFNRNDWGQGYAGESVRAAIEWVFTKENAHRLVAFCNPLNQASWRLMERVGMRREGTLKKNIYFWKDESGQPLWQDTYEYGLLREEYQSIV